MTTVSLEKLLESGAHFGHQTKRWNPRMGEFVYGVRDGVYIFDLIKTKSALEKALKAISQAAKAKKLILLVGTKKQAKEKVKEVGVSTGICYVDERWLGGTLTNFEQIRGSIKTLNRLKTELEEGKYDTYTKKERLLISRDIEKLERNVGGLQKLEKLPDMMIVVDTRREHAAVSEARKNDIELVGLVDTNADPNEVTWPIPMNDDSPQALDYVLDLIKEELSAKKVAIKKAKKK